MAKGFNLAAGFLASLVTIIGFLFLLVNYQQVADFYNKTFLTRAYWEKVLNTLSVQVNSDVFDTRLGKPLITNYVSEGYHENIYVQKDFYVQALVGRNDKILIFSITTRNINFRPYIRQANVNLGITTFAQVGPSPDMAGGAVGFHDYYYEELYYRGNPGNYLTYAYAVSDAAPYTGFSDDKLAGSNFRDAQDKIDQACKDNVTKDAPTVGDGVTTKTLKQREKVAITSVGFIGPYPGFLCEGVPLPYFSPDENQVRLLNE